LLNLLQLLESGVSMGTNARHLSIAVIACAMALPASGQAALTLAGQAQAAAEHKLVITEAPMAETPRFTATASETASVEALLDFKASDVKFNLQELTEILRDRRHEGWVLAAYPDPKTHRPLIGAGFSLDLPAREHLQRDPLNPRSFIEPSSAELWRAAGLEPTRLNAILERFGNQYAKWKYKGYRKRIKTLTPEITDEEATMLLRISAIQAAYNARAYCRNFDQLGASQQMAMSQLVYQMGVNLEQFSQFLALVNSDSSTLDASAMDAPDAEHWKAVQASLIHSQWARLYRTRAIAVIAMLDPQYADDPAVAEQRVGATLHPAVVHRRKGRAAVSRQLASSSGNRRKPTRKNSSTKRKV
jgi:hypothetical protein